MILNMASKIDSYLYKLHAGKKTTNLTFDCVHSTFSLCTTYMFAQYMDTMIFVYKDAFSHEKFSFTFLS